MKDEFMLCGECKSVLQKLPGEVLYVADAGKGLETLQAGVVEASKEKHIPVVHVNDSQVIVEVGSVAHPMVSEHYILWIMLRTDKGFMYRILTPGEPAAAVFDIQPDEKPLRAYEMCNVHGLWKKEIQD